MVVITTLYNSEAYIQHCLRTIMHQSFGDFTCYITDDCSTDRSGSVAREFIKSDRRFVLIENQVKLYQPGNYDWIIRDNPDIDDEALIVEVDGDDWLPDKDVLKRVNAVYQEGSVWIANGRFVYADGRPGFAAPPADFEKIREEAFTASHIRTWKAFLWRAIKPDYLKDESGNFWEVAGDVAFMLPMLEMAGPQHYRFMPEINYVYNEGNPINDHKVSLAKVVKTAGRIRKNYRYTRLSR